MPSGRLSPRLATVAGLAVLLFLLWLVFPSGFFLRIATLVWINALAAVGLNLLMGLAGQVSLGHAGFVGIGAYAVALGPRHLGLDPCPRSGSGCSAPGCSPFSSAGRSCACAGTISRSRRLAWGS